MPLKHYSQALLTIKNGPLLSQLKMKQIPERHFIHDLHFHCLFTAVELYDKLFHQTGLPIM